MLGNPNAQNVCVFVCLGVCICVGERKREREREREREKWDVGGYYFIVYWSRNISDGNCCWVTFCGAI